ncbi:MAG: hypothetical protein HPM95_14235 [Alphaproteobacteria bacterium]|nr:hypothetical protein [Alphaproteobacteria bacterium]
MPGNRDGGIAEDIDTDEQESGCKTSETDVADFRREHDFSKNLEDQEDREPGPADLQEGLEIVESALNAPTKSRPVVLNSMNPRKHQ